MKRFPVLLSLVLIATLLLAACGDADMTDTPATPGAGVVTETAMVPETGSDVEMTPTLAVDATEVVTDPTPVAGATEQATPVAGDDMNQCRAYQLDDYLDYEVANADGEEIGEVDGVVIFRDATITGAEGAPDFSNFQAGQYGNPQVAYFVVDFNDDAGFGDGETLMPFGAFNPLNNETPFEDCRMMFASAYEMTDFPVWDWDDRPDFTVDNWDEEWVSFWGNLGVTVPRAAAGGQGLGNPVVFDDDFDDINVLNLEGEDLGEIEDFIIVPSTGELSYAILAAGGFLGLGERLIPIPMNRVVWGEFGDDQNDMGVMYINHPDDGWENAPVIENLDNFDFSIDTWSDEYDAYWEGLNVTTP